MTDPEVLIRRARPDDADEILALEALFPTDRMSPRTVRRFLRVDSARVWVAEREGAAVGNLVLLRRRGSLAARIYSVAVDPALRGRRIGEHLVHAAEQAARAEGCREMRLEVRPDNAAAQALYARLGYRSQRRLPGFYEDGSDALRLVRRLAS